MKSGRKSQTPTAHIYPNVSLGLAGLFRIFPPQKNISQEMLAIARAFMTQPRFIIMDEPSEGLAPAILDILVKFFNKSYAESNTSILLVEQNLGFCQRITDRTNVMNTGTIAYSGSLKELRSDKILSKKLPGVG